MQIFVSVYLMRHLPPHRWITFLSALAQRTWLSRAAASWSPRSSGEASAWLMGFSGRFSRHGLGLEKPCPCLDLQAAFSCWCLCSLRLSRPMLATSGATSVNKRSIPSFVTSVVAPQKSQTIKVPNFEWFKFPTYKIVFGENLFLQQGMYIFYIYGKITIIPKPEWSGILGGFPY